MYNLSGEYDAGDIEASFVQGIIFDARMAVELKPEIMAFDERNFLNDQWRFVFGIIKELVAKDTPPTHPLVIPMIQERAGADLELARQVAFGFRTQGNLTQSVTLELLKQIKERGTRARLSNKLSTAAAALQTPGTDIEDICSKTQRSLMDVEIGAAKPRTRGAGPLAIEVLKELHENIVNNNKTPGLMTGFPKLDEATRGLRPGTLNLLAARPGVGKTALALNIMEHVAMNTQEDKPVLFFSLEMSQKDIILRMISSFAQLSQAQIEAGAIPTTTWPKIISSVKAIAPAALGGDDGGARQDRLFINDQSGISASAIWNEARRIAQEHAGLSLIVVDYVQIIKPESGRADNVNQQIKETNNILSCMAKELQCPLILLSQLNRDIDRRANKRPTNADLRDSGALEADADLIMFLTKNTEGTASRYGSETVMSENVTLSITKNRRGSLTDIPLNFYGAWYKFSE